jgi:hypothetical protein
VILCVSLNITILQTLTVISRLKRKFDLIKKEKLFREGDTRLKGILNGRSSSHSSGWLHCVPAKWLGFRFESIAFKRNLRYHSGIPQVSDQRSSITCPLCKKPSDVFGDHAISCGSTDARIARHDTLTRFLKTKIRELGYFVPKGEGMAGDLNKQRMGDIVVHQWRLLHDLWIDLSVANTLCPSYSNISANAPLAAADLRVKMKYLKYKDQIHLVDSFVPLVVETLGGWHPSAFRILKRIGNELAERSWSSSKSGFSNLMTGLSVCLQKANANMLALRF